MSAGRSASGIRQLAFRLRLKADLPPEPHKGGKGCLPFITHMPEQTEINPASSALDSLLHSHGIPYNRFGNTNSLTFWNNEWLCQMTFSFVIPALHSLGTVGVHVLQSTGSQVSAGGIQYLKTVIFQGVVPFKTIDTGFFMHQTYYGQ